MSIQAEANLSTYLAGVLGNPVTGVLTGDATYRKYVSAIRTTAKIAGNDDTSVKTVVYEVGRGHETKAATMAVAADTAVRLDASYPTGMVQATDFGGLARKYSNFAGNFEYSNLCGVVERIARGLACSTLFANVGTQTLRAGRPYSIQALGTYGGPVSVSETTVFIPRLVDSLIAPDVFAVLSSAVAGEGGSVATDVLNLGIDNRPSLMEVGGLAFPQACIDALRLLGGNFAASGAGCLFAFALTKGLHKALTVVGHSDEGGVFRDVMRVGNFSVPFGGISSEWGSTYTGIPALSSNDWRQVSCYVDALVLVTAGLVAHCDPGITYNGMWFPTVLQGHDAFLNEVSVGRSQEGSAAHALTNSALLIKSFPAFSGLYIGALTKLFGFGSGGREHTAERAFNACSMGLGADCRHLKYASVAPFFFVEPTSLVPRDFAGTPAENEGFAAYATKNVEWSMDAFEAIESADGGSSFNGVMQSHFVVKMRGARAMSFLAHWHGHLLNGLSAITIKQMTPTSIIHPSVIRRGGEVMTVGEALEQGATLDEYLWTRGQSGLVHPAEFLNLSGTIGITIQHCTMDANYNIEPMHVPGVHEVPNCWVSFLVSAPCGVAAGPSNIEPRDIARARTRATRELAASANRARAFGTASFDGMVYEPRAPLMSGSKMMPNDVARFEHGMGSVVPSLGAVSQGAGPNPGGPAGVVQATPVLQMQPLRAPQLQHLHAGGRGGGSEPHRANKAPEEGAVPRPAAVPAPADDIAIPAGETQIGSADQNVQ